MKFGCPHCGQHIAVAKEDLNAFWDRKITCPACDGRVVLRKPRASGGAPNVEAAPPRKPDRTQTVHLKAPEIRPPGTPADRPEGTATWHEPATLRKTRVTQLPQFWIAVTALLVAAAIIGLSLPGRGTETPGTIIRLVDSNVAVACARDAVAAEMQGERAASWISSTVLTNWRERCVVVVEVDFRDAGGDPVRRRYLCCVALNEDNTYSYDPETGVTEIGDESPGFDKLEAFLSRNR